MGCILPYWPGGYNYQNLALCGSEIAGTWSLKRPRLDHAYSVRMTSALFLLPKAMQLHSATPARTARD